MAQLVKLLDYISRYENDLTRYPNQFLRLKKYHWNRMSIQWESGRYEPEEEIVQEEIKKKNRFSALFNFLKGNKGEKDEIESNLEEVEEDEDEEMFGFNPNIIYAPNSPEQLRKLYLDQLFHFQIKWASSTLMAKSNVAPKYLRDSLLRSFLQELPDSYLLFYDPIIKLQKAPIELDVILITPVECLCITVIEEEDLSVFSYDNNRFWIKRVGEKEMKVLNPLISLNRMTKIVTQLFEENGIEFPVRKILISRNGYIDYPLGGYDLQIIDRRSYEEWFNSMKKMVAPLKFTQFRAAQTILDIGQTTARSRLLEDEGNEEGEDLSD